MKILFVCRGNTGRSQVAEEIYNRLSGAHTAESAGTKVVDSAKTVVERKPAQGVIEAMDSLGFDIRDNKRVQLTIEMLSGFNKVIVMAEPENIPDWLSNSPKYEYWKIEDIKGKSKSEALEIIKIIEQKVNNLIKI